MAIPDSELGRVTVPDQEHRGAVDDQRMSDPGDEPAGRLGGNGTAHRERRHAERRVQGAVAQPTLEVEGEHEGKPCLGREVEQGKHHARGVRRPPEQP